METKLLEALNYIDPDDYNDWFMVGAALKHEGYDVSVWDDWSRKSVKYQDGVCEKKWGSFQENNSGAPVTAGTIIQMAKDNGWNPTYQSEGFGWDDLVEEDIGRDYKIIDSGFVKEIPIPEISKKYDPKQDLIDYLSLLFKPNECVGYCDKLTLTKDSKGNDKWTPTDGKIGRTQKELLDKLTYGFDKASIKAESDGGALIRFNPLDGNGEADANVTDFRYCLIESDVVSVEKQFALYKEMKLPIKVLVNSGNKSLHAIVHIDAGKSNKLFRERVNFVYEFCRKNGLVPDEQDKNASRYSRMPGIKRNGKYQYIVDYKSEFDTFDQWKEWVEAENDNLPPCDNLEDVWENMPPLKDELIEGLLRVGHKMLISGPSKAGKSFFQIELAICMAEGLEFMGHKCKQGKVAYINLELDKNSCFHRFKDIYKKLGIVPNNKKNITIWNLRGMAVPMNKLAPFLIRRFKNKGYVAVIIDPIYKVITGDENNATEMAEFCANFDKVSIEANTAMIYCHHYSKGASAKYSRAVDRSSGSGVFARDPDAIIDLMELEATDSMVDNFNRQNPDACETLTAWEMTATLREFATPAPIRMWFDYPVHKYDKWNFLAEAKNGETSARGKGVGKKQRAAIDWDKDVKEATECLGGLPVSFKSLVGYLQKNGKPSERTIRDKLSKIGYKVIKSGDDFQVLKNG